VLLSAFLKKYFKERGGYWMNLQLRYELYIAQQAEAGALKTIKPLTA
jgi:plasmid maintenance system antidote protein VapI